MSIADTGKFFKDLLISPFQSFVSSYSSTWIMLFIILSSILIVLLVIFLIRIHRFRKAQERLAAREDALPLHFAGKTGSKRSDERKILMEIDRLLMKEDEIVLKEQEFEARENTINKKIAFLHDRALGIRKGLYTKDTKNKMPEDKKVKAKKEDKTHEDEKKDTIDAIRKASDSHDIDEDTKKVLKICDELLGELPDEVIDKFTKTDDFQLYQKVLKKVS